MRRQFYIEPKHKDMKKVIVVNGLIAGLIVAVLMIFSLYHCMNTGDMVGGMIYGYTAMIIAFSMIFVGVKTFRDKYQSGVISFGKAFKVGILITLIASSIYVVCWLIEYYAFIPDFADIYAKHTLDKLQSSGASAAQLSAKTAEMADLKEMYKNPFFVILFTYFEILPVGLLVTIISALVLKRKRVAFEKVKS